MGSNTFQQKLREVLRAHPDGLSEFELIKQLEASGETGFESGCLANPLSLFQTHFLLFNGLYQLADQLASQGNERLSIHTLCIQLSTTSPSKAPQEISMPDAMREYYLDLSNLENTNEGEVEELLSLFWARFLANDDRADALATLNLQDPVDWQTIKTQHRRLAMQHHPDRGGDEQQLQAINAAMTMLQQTHGK